MATNRLETILAQARELAPEELAQLIKKAADMLAQGRVTEPEMLRYTALFGSGKGSFKNPDEVDRFIRQERDAWDE